MGLMPTASANSLIVERGWRRSVCNILSLVLFITGSIPAPPPFVNNIDKYHKYYRRLIYLDTAPRNFLDFEWPPYSNRFSTGGFFPPPMQAGLPPDRPYST